MVCTKSAFLEVPMLDCLKLLERYQIEMFCGKGHVDMMNAISVLESIFDKIFFKENQKIKRVFSKLLRSSEEFALVVESLKEHKTIQLEGEKPKFQFSTGFQKNIKDIDFLAAQHFPLCMWEMYRAFKREKHLKHMGRLQLILFIRGLGFKAEEVIQFFKKLVSRGPSSKKLKEYEYSIKHAYGLIGSKTEYSGFGCPKIIANSRPSKGDVHGCPYNYYGEDQLRKLLMSKLNNEMEVADILASNSMGPKFGCRRYFCSKNKIKDIEDLNEGVGRHPNLYFNISYFKKGSKTAQMKRKALLGSKEDGQKENGNGQKIKIEIEA